MHDFNTINLYKNKGDHSDCNSYQGISLLVIVGKVYAWVMLKRLQILAAHIYPESQCGFRAGRSTIDMVFPLKQLQEKCREQCKPLYISFIDLTKAFEFLSRDGFFKILKKIGCPPRLLSIISSFHENTHCTINFDCTSSQTFKITSGVKQECVLASTLFGIFFSTLLQYAFQDSQEAVFLYTRSDGILFNLAKLRAKARVNKFLICELLFADDAALVSHTVGELQKLLNRFSYACKEFGLTISIKKTKVMDQEVDNPPNVMIDGTPLDAMNTFTYLGATITSNLSLNEEITMRICKASASIASMDGRTGNLPWQPRSAPTELVSSAACCTVVKHGQLMPIMKQDWTAFTFAAQGTSWESHRRIKYPTPRFHSKLELQVCTTCLCNAICTGLAMWDTWVMAESPKTYYMVN